MCGDSEVWRDDLARWGQCGACQEKEELAQRDADRVEAVAWARTVLADPHVVVLDTETTDLYGEVIEIVVLTMVGEVLLESLVCPTGGLGPISPVATEVHGLTMADVAEAPTFAQLYDQVATILQGASRIVAWNSAFDYFAQRKELDLFPKEIEPEHAKLSDFIYDNVNNGVYKAGFATRQRPYEIACRRVFQALDELEERLSKNRYLFGNRIVEADWRLFCTLVRFDAVYHGHFKCNLRRIIDYPNLQAYLMDLYQQPGIADTVNFDHNLITISRTVRLTRRASFLSGRCSISPSRTGAKD